MRFAALALALMTAAPAVAQDAPPPAVPAAPAEVATPAPAAPAPMAPEAFMNNPEYMVALDLSTGGRVIIQLRPRQGAAAC